MHPFRGQSAIFCHTRSTQDALLEHISGASTDAQGAAYGSNGKAPITGFQLGLLNKATKRAKIEQTATGGSLMFIGYQWTIYIYRYIWYMWWMLISNTWVVLVHGTHSAGTPLAGFLAKICTAVFHTSAWETCQWTINDLEIIYRFS